MKKYSSIRFLICICIFCFTSLSLSAQYYEKIGFEKGDVDLSLGIGLMPTFIDKNTRPAMPPVSMILTYRPKKHLAVSSYIGYSATDYKMSEADKSSETSVPLSLRNNFFVTGLRGEGHFIRDRVDFYGGGMIAYCFSINNNAQTDHNGRIENIRVESFSDQIVWSGLVGVKYLLSPKIGIYGEICYGVSLFNAGVTFKL